MRYYLILPITLLFFQNTLAQSIDYETEIQPIFNNSCMPCHQGNNPSAGLDLSSYETVMNGSNNGNVITIGNYQNSVLWQEVSSGDMPNNIANNNMGIADLTNEEVTLIENWILDLGCAVVDCADGYECILGECICINDADGDEICDEHEIDGCTNELACNYDIEATENNNSCEYPGDECEGFDLNLQEVVYGVLDDNCECGLPLSIDMFLETKKIIKVVNLWGQETKVKSSKNTLIYLYDDGSVKKLKTIK